MRIRIKDNIYEGITVDNRIDAVTLVTKTEDISHVIEDIYESGIIEILGDDDVIAGTIKETYTNTQVSINDDIKSIRLCKKVESPEEIMTKRLDEQKQIVSLVFVKMANDGELDDVTISEHPSLFPEWDENWTGVVNTVVREGDILYRSLHDITNTAQNTRPSETPSMWVMVSDPTVEYPEWAQPIGAHDAYALGDKTTYDGKKWVSTVDGNVWKPGIYGWEGVE